MNTKRIHQLLGIAMLLPLLLWSLTGIVFLIKPGYEGAYQKIGPKFYDIDTAFSIVPAKGWSEMRLVKTVLGYHLIVNVDGTWQHLDPNTQQQKPLPQIAELRLLLSDAMALDSERYGLITDIIDNTAYTNTGIELSLDWSNLTLRQQGTDTQLIRLMYKIHYIEWFGVPSVDKTIGAFAIALLLILSTLGLTLYLRGKKITER
ncbi:MAG: hypothetical protein ACI9WS_002759 [Paraglaciecola psychrophila]